MTIRDTPRHRTGQDSALTLVEQDVDLEKQHSIATDQ